MFRKIACALTLVLIFNISSFSIQQSNSCDLKKAQIPAVRSFKLGLTKKEVIRLHPKLGSKDLPWHRPDPNGYVEISFDDYGEFERLLPEIDREGLSSIKLAFLDDRLVKLRVVYNGFTEWGNINEFLSVMITHLKLPEASRWEKAKTEISEIRRLVCKELMIEVELEPRVSQYALETPSLTIIEAGLETELLHRESTRKERKRKIFKP